MCSSIYHFDPTNLPPCNKLQMTAASPTTPTAPSPTFPSNDTAQNRKKFKPKPNTLRESDDDDGGGVAGDGEADDPSANCDIDGSNSDVVRNNSNPEIEISSLPCNESVDAGATSDAPTAITVNSLLAPINQIHADNYSNSGGDNDSDGKCYSECLCKSACL